MQTLKIKPLTHKMKNRVANYGNEFEVLESNDGEYLLKQLNLPDPSQPYMCWVIEGEDFEIL